MKCENCGQDRPLDRFNPDCNAPDWCFGCRARGISVAFAGGKQLFHDETNAALQRTAINEAVKAGFDPVPAETGKAWNGASSAALKTVGDASKKAGAFGGKPAVTPAATKVGGI